MLHSYEFKNPHVLSLPKHSCATSYTKNIVCIDHQGNLKNPQKYKNKLQIMVFQGFQHSVSVSFCSCEPEAVTLVRYNMWPATPANPQLAFHQDLLLWLESLQLEACIGIDAFCRALEHKVGRYVRKKVYTAIMNDCMLDALCCTFCLQFRNVYPIIIDAFEEFRYLFSL